MKKIAVFTSTRAEYGLMKTLIRKFCEDKDFELFLLVSSSHINSKFGNTLKEIENDGFVPDYLIPVPIINAKKHGMAKHGHLTMVLKKLCRTKRTNIYYF